MLERQKVAVAVAVEEVAVAALGKVCRYDGNFVLNCILREIINLYFFVIDIFT